ncbi:hypothetical protein BJX64DRAFT_280884 [Aspergillus heterothallicus]
MSSLRFARSALRARPAAFRVPLQRRGYAEAVSDKIKLSLVLPHQVNIPAESGEMGVLANHVPSIEQLKPGLVEIVEEGGANKKFFLSGGFAVVQPNSELSINAVEGFPLEDFSAENVRAQIAEAQKIASGNGSEQDIAEAKIELEDQMTAMAQGLPTNMLSSFPSEVGFAQENEIPGGCLFESPQGWCAKTMASERNSSASPQTNRRDSHPFDTLDIDNDYKDLLFNFPRLYSDRTSDKDPFLDRGMPMNPHNTPISLSGNQSELGSWQKEKQNVIAPAQADKDTLDRSQTAGSYYDDPLTSLLNSRRARPLRPPEPSFLSDIHIPCSGEEENIPPVFAPGPIHHFERKSPRPETPYRSLPLRSGRNVSQYTERPVPGQALEPCSSRPKQSWETRSIIPCRYFSRSFSGRELEILGIPLNKPDMPFPAPIPTVDNLPLRRGIVGFDWEKAEQLPVNTDDSTITSAKQTASTNASTLWRLPHQVFSVKKLARSMMHRLPWRNDGATTKETSIVRTDMLVPHLSRCETLPIGPEPVSVVDPVDGTCILHINIVFPLLYLNHIARITAVIRGCIPSRIGRKLVSIVWAFFQIAFWWLLAALRFEVGANLRRLQENQSGLLYM